MAVEAGGAQGRRVGARGRVDVDAALHQQLHHGAVAGGRGAPQRRRTLDRLTVKYHCRGERGGGVLGGRYERGGVMEGVG